MKMSMPKVKGMRSPKPHVRLQKLKSVAKTAFPSSPMAFPPQGDPSMGGGAPAMGGGAPDPMQAMAAPPAAGPPAAGDMGQ